MQTQLLLIQAMTPLHAGTGQAVGAIDLPIARERPTGIPLIPGSSIKGALRARDTSALCEAIYGPPTERADDGAGAVQFADAHLILLPVRSLAGTFAWVTSPYLLSRFARDAREAGYSLPEPPAVSQHESCRVLSERLHAALGQNTRVVLEDLDFTPLSGQDPALSAFASAIGKGLFPTETPADIAARGALTERLCLVHDDTMAHLLESATEVMARIRLDSEKKTVERGGLWYEEALPAESVLVGLAVASPVRRGGKDYQVAELLDGIRNNTQGLVQLGGKATIGRGLCRVQLPVAAKGGAA